MWLGPAPTNTHYHVDNGFKVLARLMVTVFVTMSTRTRQAGSKRGMGTLRRLRGMGTLRAIKEIPDGPKSDAWHGNP